MRFHFDYSLNEITDLSALFFYYLLKLSCVHFKKKKTNHDVNISPAFYVPLDNSNLNIIVNEFPFLFVDVLFLFLNKNLIRF